MKVAEAGMVAAAAAGMMVARVVARLAVGVVMGTVEAAGTTPTWRLPQTLTSSGMSMASVLRQR
jgi:hypothetical protein